MKYLNCTDFQLHNSAVCLGKFDAVHIGHQKLLSYAVEQKARGLTPVVFTFSVHPGTLRGKKELELIYTEEEKRSVMEKLGIEVFLSYPFDEAMFAMEAPQFVEEILIKKMDAKAVIVGTDFHFGRNRSGDAALLRRLMEPYGFEVTVFDKVVKDGEAVSSTRIREAVHQGDMKLVRELMGRPYDIMGEVVHGKQLGRSLGMPTANITLERHKLLPPNGVYVSRTYVNGKAYEGISNVGVKPTVAKEQEKLLETYLFEYAGDLYGKRLRVELLHYERPEQRFSSISELKVRMEKDVSYGKNYFREQSLKMDGIDSSDRP